MVRRTGMPLHHLIHTIIPDLIRGGLSARPAIKDCRAQTGRVPRERREQVMENQRGEEMREENKSTLQSTKQVIVTE